MLENFGSYLKRRRRDNGLTQDRLALALSCHSTTLGGIDSVTISRWERGTTEPTLERQRHVIHFFQDDADQVLPFRSARPNLLSPEQSVGYLIRHYLNSPKLGSKVGTFPEKENRKYEVCHLSGSDVDDPFIELILDYDHSIFEAGLPVSHELLHGWIGHSNVLSVVSTKFSHYFGHLIALPLAEDIYWRLIHGEMEEAEIRNSDIVPPEEPHGLYIYSLYGASKIAAALLLIEMAHYAGKYLESIRHIGGLCATSDGARLARSFHLQPGHVGPEIAHGPVRYQGREVQYLTYTAPLVSILKDAGLRRILPFH